MNIKLLKKSLEKRIILLDGSTGAALQRRGMPSGVCPEKWALDNPEALIQLQKEYINAGSEIILTFTLGGTRAKLSEYGMEKEAVKINTGLAEVSKKTAGKNALVAGDIGPTGRFPRPFGDMAFAECVDMFKEQVCGLLKGGVDLFLIETMFDIQEARAALLAVKESCSLPVMVSMTYDETQRTITGTDPVSALITLQNLGADFVGVNCSTGPKEIVRIIKIMKPYAEVPLFAKPNAGLPRLVKGKTVFKMGAGEFASYTKAFVKAGVNMLGGCCGTTPEFIKEIKKKLKGSKPAKAKIKPYSAVSSSRNTVMIGAGKEPIIVGERINPTGKKLLQEELRQGKTTETMRFAQEQLEHGAKILDVNVGMPGIDEKQTMTDAVELLSAAAESPLCIDSSSPDVIESALRIYPGRALINSISGEKNKLKKLLPVAARYGAMFILLPITEKGVPETAEKRIAVIKKVFKEAQKYGFEKKDIVIDGLVMTVSSNRDAAKETLKVIAWAKKNGFNSIVGLSNVSFGLPERQVINSTFFSLARKKGLTMAIANPMADLTIKDKMAEDVLLGRDKNAAAFIARFSQIKPEAQKQASRINTTDAIFNAVVKGNKESIVDLIDTALKEKQDPKEITDNILIPAINKVGELYDKKEYFLPQLIASAEAMKTAFAKLEPLLAGKTIQGNKAKIVIATVKGDIHDIGKNIVVLMLKNYGFEVYDLGKDVHEYVIVAKAKEVNPDIIALSALMTTTMVEMKVVIDKAKQEGLKCKFLIGGAVITSAFAQEIGADGYARDAYEAVKKAKILTGK